MKRLANGLFFPSGEQQMQSPQMHTRSIKNEAPNENIPTIPP